MNFNAIIDIGIVVSNFDAETETGKLSVKLEKFDTAVDVTYVSPFYFMNGGGVLAIPEVGSKVIVFTDANTDESYYLGTIIDAPSNPEKGGAIGWTPIGKNRIYSEKGIPQKVMYTNQVGAGLSISRKFLPNYINAKVNLDSEKGKRISLSDSPNSDCILIRNEHGDGIVVTSQENDVHADRSIEVKSKGLQQYVSFQSAMNLYVIEGKDITLENFSTGANSNTTAAASGRFGNVNLKSHNADINITGKGSDSNIFITTPKARVEIKSDGSVLIDSQGDIRMQSLGNIELKSTAGDINLEALNINMKSAIETKMSSLNTTIDATVKFAAGGAIAILEGNPQPIIKGPVTGLPIVATNATGYIPPILQPIIDKSQTRTDYGD
jgi:hypothetical protein